MAVDLAKIVDALRAIEPTPCGAKLAKPSKDGRTTCCKPRAKGDTLCSQHRLIENKKNADASSASASDSDDAPHCPIPTKEGKQCKGHVTSSGKCHAHDDSKITCTASIKDGSRKCNNPRCGPYDMCSTHLPVHLLRAYRESKGIRSCDTIACKHLPEKGFSVCKSCLIAAVGKAISEA